MHGTVIDTKNIDTHLISQYYTQKKTINTVILYTSSFSNSYENYDNTFFSLVQ